MPDTPPAIAAFLACKRVAVAGVSRSGKEPANAIFRRLRDTGHDTVPVNPKAAEIEGMTCYLNIESVPGVIDAVMVVTHPKAAADVVRAALDRGVKHIWFHRSFGEGSVSEAAVALCRARGVQPIVGGCPMMYCPPIDPAHRIFRWWLTRQKRISSA